VPGDTKRAVRALIVGHQEEAAVSGLRHGASNPISPLDRKYYFR
jgi:hypothetical protein